MNAVISSSVDEIERLKKELHKIPSMQGLELASRVSTKKPYFFGNSDSNIKIAAIDLGIKKNILKNLSSRGAYIKVFPMHSTLDEIIKWKPDGYFLSNGPGDPEPLEDIIKITSAIIDKSYPLFGICLGHQIIALSQGVSTSDIATMLWLLKKSNKDLSDATLENPLLKFLQISPEI